MEQRKKSYYNCSVDGCLNSTLNGELAFFKLPAVTERRTEWLKLIHREDLLDTSSRRSRVCEAHFRPNCIKINSSRKLLKKNSTPQLLLPFSNTADKGVQAVIETTNANNSAEAQQSQEEVPVTIKEEIEDVFSEHEDDLIEKLENRKRSNETIVPDVEPVKVRKIDRPEVLLPIEVAQRDVYNMPRTEPFPMDFIKTVMDSQNEILTILKSQMFLQDPDEELMKFLRLVGARLQGLESDKRLEMQTRILNTFNDYQ